MDSAELPQGKELLSRLLNTKLTIQLTDGRTLIGTFVCVDREANIIIASALEYPDGEVVGDGRILGLAMVPGRHVTSVKAEKEALLQ